MKSTRQRLLNIIKNKPDCTAAELGRALQLTQADVRHHLSNMIVEGLIVVTGTKRDGRRGRPARQFSIAASAHGENFNLLSSALLAASLPDLSPSRQIAYFQQVASHLAGENIPNGALAQRLVGAVEKLNKIGYNARWEAHADAPHLILEHRPFASLQSQHPELMQLDTILLETLLSESVQQVEAPIQEDDGDNIFLIGKTGSK